MWPAQKSSKNTKYLPVNQAEAEEDHEDSSYSNILARYRLIASGPFPAVCDVLSHDSNSNKLMEDCIVGGVLWKLQQFCRSQQRAQDQAKFWRTHVSLLVVYVIVIVGLGTLLDGKATNDDTMDQDNNNTTIPQQEQETDNLNRMWVGVGVLVVTALYFLVLVFLGARLGLSQTFRTKLETLIQEISDQLEPYGLKLVQDDNAAGFFTRSSHIYVNLKKQSSQPLTALPLVNPEFQKQSTMESTKVTVESILYYGGHSPSFTNTSATRFPLPVDDWIAGGLMMRLRRDRHRASLCSRLLLMLILLPSGLLCILRLAQDTTNLHNDLLALAIGGGLTLAYGYLRECLDASAIHSVSRAVVKQFSGLAKERHDINLHYEVQPGDFLPRTTKGVVRFEPNNGGAVKTKKLASLAFV